MTINVKYHGALTFPLMICIRGSVAYFETGKTQNEQHQLQCCIDHTAHLKCQPYMTDQCKYQKSGLSQTNMQLLLKSQFECITTKCMWQGGKKKEKGEGKKKKDFWHIVQEMKCKNTNMEIVKLFFTVLKI